MVANDLSTSILHRRIEGIGVCKVIIRFDDISSLPEAIT